MAVASQQPTQSGGGDQLGGIYKKGCRCVQRLRAEAGDVGCTFCCLLERIKRMIGKASHTLDGTGNSSSWDT